MLTTLGLRNFRAFEDAGLQLAPVTVLVGPNNSGKSSIISGLRVLAQTMQSEDYRVPLVLNGLLGDFGTYKDLVYQNDKRRRIGIMVGTTLPKQTFSKEAIFQLTFAYRTQRREIVLVESSLQDDSGRRVLVTKALATDPSKHRVDLLATGNGHVGTNVRRQRARLVHFVPRALPVGFALSPESAPPGRRRSFWFAETATGELIRALRSIEYLGPFRAEPKRTNLFSGESPTTVGMDGARAIDMVASDYLRRGRRKKVLLNQVIQWLRKASIARELKVRLLSDRHYEILIQHPVTGEIENLADVGYGSSQVLPVIAGGYNAPADSTFIVEQPELHLHPKAQSELGDFFFEVYERGVQCILETHSEHLILRLQRHVAEGRIPPKDLVVYFVHAQHGQKQISKLTLDSNGIFQEEWPLGFFEERLSEVTALARAPLARA